MKFLKKFKNVLFFFSLLLVFLVSACEISSEDQTLLDEAKANREKNKENSIAKGEIYSAMKDFYLWRDEIPKMDTTDATDIQTFYYNMLYRSLDHWSFILNKTEYDNMMNATYYGHGFGTELDANGDIRISYVFDKTQSFNKGLKRGWKIESVNGIVPLSLGHLDELLGESTLGISNSFRFEKEDGSIVSIKLTKEEVTMNTILDYRTFVKGSKTIGYVAVQSFMGDSLAVATEYANVFSYFNKQGISELIIDLRYNTGGQTEYAELLGNIILGKFRGEYVYSEIVFNDYVNDYMKSQGPTVSHFASNANSLNKELSRIFFLTSASTASASELLISCLSPYVETHLIGSRTAGKRVGMIPLQMKKSDNILVPIMFEWMNSKREKIKYTGIPVEEQEFDDLMHVLGDENEACLAQALNFIQYGSYLNKKKSASEFDYSYKRNLKGYRAYLNAF